MRQARIIFLRMCKKSLRNRQTLHKLQISIEICAASDDERSLITNGNYEKSSE